MPAVRLRRGGGRSVASRGSVPYAGAGAQGEAASSSVAGVPPQAPGQSSAGEHSPAAHGGSHAALKAAWCRGQKRECAFLCGATSWDTDEEDTDQAYKWAYPDVNKDGTRRAANCFYCEKVFVNEYKHKAGRKEMQARMGKSKAMQDEWRARKKVYLERRRAS